MAETWREGLLGCFKDGGNCIKTCFCPCISSASNKARVDGRECTVCDCCCGAYNVEYFTRQQIRAKYGMDYSPCGDCLAILCCGPCAICQHHREMEVRDREGSAPRGGAMGGMKY